MSSSFALPAGENLRLEIRVLEKGIVRITCAGHDTQGPSLLERYGIVEEPPADDSAEPTEKGVRFGEYELVSSGNGWSLRKGSEVVAETAEGYWPASAPTAKRNQGYRLALKMREGEKILGLGDTQRQKLMLNGLSGDLWIQNPVCHIPVPFVLSSRGYGIFFNTTRRLVYDVGKSEPGKALFSVEKSFLDIYLFTGDSLAEMINKFTLLTGRPHLPPMKAFGVWLIMWYWSDHNDVQMIASGLRERKMPCDNISLEPGWMSKNYDHSVTRDWSQERFTACAASYGHGCVEHLIRCLGFSGYNLGLWLCCLWDFTYEEERAIMEAQEKGDVAPDDPALEDNAEFERIDPRITRGSFLDNTTQRDQGWFEHLKKFVDDGVSYFKLDGCSMMSAYPDRLYANGYTDADMHNLVFLLEARHTFEDFEKYTNRRSYGIYPCGTTGVQRYAGTWTGDTGGGREPMIGLLQSALVGHSFCSCDVENWHIPGIHMGYLIPWTILNCWGTAHYPGYLNDELNTITRDYANLRMRLVEYYYSLAYESCTTGMPLMRPLCLSYPNEEWSYSEDVVFTIGEFLLADAYSDDDIRLPAGKWYDMWTGKVYTGDGSVQNIPVPKNRGGHLFVKEGALIPLLPVRQYVDPKAVNEIEWLVFPSEKDASFTLYLDDGESLKHREDDFALQKVTRKGRELVFGEITGGTPEFLRDVKHTVRVIGE